MTSRTWAIQLIGALLLILLLVYSIPIIKHKIAAKMTQNVEEILHKQGYSWVKVIMKGRDVIVKGQTANVSEHQKVIEQIRSIWFVQNISDEITPIIIEPYTLNLHWDGQTLSIDGYLASQQSKQNINQYIQQHFTGNEIKENLQLGIGSPEHWQSLTKVLLQQIKKLSFASIQMVDRTIEVRGKAQTSEQVASLEKAIIPLVKKYNYQFSNQIIALDQSIIFCQHKFNTLLKDTKINFKSGSSIIDSGSDTLLKSLADTAIFCADSNILIIGHTDNFGDEQANIKLSTQRAQAVKGLLFSRGGIPLEHLKTEGRGSSEPIDSNDTKQGQASNRRIELIVDGL